MSSIDQADLFEITNRALADNLPEEVDLAFLYGIAENSQRSAIEAGARLYKEGFSKKMGVPWADKSVYAEWISRYKEANPDLAKRLEERNWPDEDGNISEYPGHVTLSEELVRLGVNKEAIVTIEPCFDHYYSTSGEGLGAVKYCQEKGIKSLSVTSVPFHQTRAFITGISALIDTGATDIKLYSCPGTSLRWNEQSSHSRGVDNSRGKTEGTRGEIVRNELKRIEAYQTSGDFRLKPLGEILEYLRQRD